MSEHARLFLSRVLPEVTGEGKYINIHWSGIGNHSKRYWDGRACKDVDEAVRTVNWVNTHGDKDIYVCMSTQTRAEEKTSAKGNKYLKATRAAHDVAEIRSLFVDVDVKVGAYETTNEALQALKGFLDAAGLPIPSAVVLSGSGGFHAHWALDKALTREQWQPLADRLSAAVRKHGLITDTQCTVDSARILRVPDTFNRKHDEPAPVKLLSIGEAIPLEVIEQALEPYKDFVPAPAVKVTSENSELGAGLPEAKAPEYTVEDLSKACPFILRSLHTGGVDNAQPLWFMSAAIATFLTDGRDALHRMSDKHPTYEAAATDELFDRLHKQRLDKNSGWPSCQRIESYGCQDCAGCPHLAKGKSPFNFVADEMPGSKVDDTLPAGYVRNPEGIICKKVILEDGAVHYIPVFPYPILKGWVTTRGEPSMHFDTRDMAFGKKQEIVLPFEAINAGDQILGKILGKLGFAVEVKEIKVTREFLVAWIRSLQSRKDCVVSADPYGWAMETDSNGTKPVGFAYGGKVWSGGEPMHAAKASPEIHFQYTPRGSSAPWKDAAAIVCEEKNPGKNAIIASAFGGPLLKATGYEGAILNIYSPESGVGKSTALKVAQAVWASPSRALQGLNDTQNAVLNKIGQLRECPIYWDEIKGEFQTKRFIQMVFPLTSGKEKSRADRDGSYRASGTWNAMLVSCSNASLMDALPKEAGNSPAGVMRLFEFQIEPRKEKSPYLPGEVQRLTSSLNENYGSAGLTYAKFLGKNGPRVWREVEAKYDELSAKSERPEQERFWIATIACLIKGAEYANQLGLVNIDVAEMEEYLVSKLERMRRIEQDNTTDLTQDKALENVIAEFIRTTQANHMLVTDVFWRGRGRAAVGSCKVLRDMTKVNVLYTHLAQDEGKLRISREALRKWLEQNNYSAEQVYRRLEADYGATVIRTALGAGTPYSVSLQIVQYEIDLDQNGLLTTVDEAMEGSEDGNEETT